MTARWLANHRRQRALRILRHYPQRGALLVNAGGRVIEINQAIAETRGYRTLARKPRYAHRRPVSAETIEELTS